MHLLFWFWYFILSSMFFNYLSGTCQFHTLYSMITHTDIHIHISEHLKGLMFYCKVKRTNPFSHMTALSSHLFNKWTNSTNYENILLKKISTDINKHLVIFLNYNTIFLLYCKYKIRVRIQGQNNDSILNTESNMKLSGHRHKEPERVSLMHQFRGLLSFIYHISVSAYH